MYEIPDEIPTAELLLDMEPEELGAKLLFLVRDRKRGAYQHLGMFKLEELQDELWQRPEAERPGYPRDTKFFEVSMALREAWAWLEAQGFIVPDSQAAQAGLKRLSRRGRRMADASSLANFAFSQRLPKTALHSKIADRVWASFVRGDYDGAVFQAMKAVEVAVRETARMSDAVIGVKLMRAAFAPKTGPLRDTESEEGEQVARMELFAGTIGSYKNPQSHRDVNLDDPAEAIETILLANHLLRIVDARAQVIADP